MKEIFWDGRLETGHAVIDADHKNLIHLYNQVVSVANHQAGKLVCNNVLDRLIEHAKAHFEWEERLMIEYAYPEKEQHIAQHEALIRQAMNYRLDPGSSDSRMPLVELSEHWLTHHMVTADQQLTSYLAAVVPSGGATDT
ncbi:MAG: hemerythrin family protein [Betaproteobacteria bacterium]|nr:hemerythrin family protein [Betaproteobacteria bacterium]MBI2961463.1 hemerythrin family protein [Betaproteobacteria bacterium]